METTEAIQLIEQAAIGNDAPQQWADLGCGTGVFTRALAHLLPPLSTVYAIDKRLQMRNLSIKKVEIVCSEIDFEKESLPFANLNGMLMANSLHYCKDQAAVLSRLSAYQRPDRENFIIVEYDNRQANRWVPYPVPFATLNELCLSLGFKKIKRLGEKKSLFRSGNLYACQVSRG